MEIYCLPGTTANQATDIVGLIPTFVDLSDPRPVKEQFNANYAHGGGWRPIEKFKMDQDGNLNYPGDPPLPPRVMFAVHKEVVVVYDSGIVAIVQPDKSFEVARMD